jgi:transcriptional regulator with XRE-family HTH domain
MLELYENIKKYRKEKHMTQDELAKKTGYTDRSSIAKIERGDVDLPQSKILLFAKALEVSAGDLMGDSGLSGKEPDPIISDLEQQILDALKNLSDSQKIALYEFIKTMRK